MRKPLGEMGRVGSSHTVTWVGGIIISNTHLQSENDEGFRDETSILSSLCSGETVSLELTLLTERG